MKGTWFWQLNAIFRRSNCFEQWGQLTDAIVYKRYTALSKGLRGIGCRIFSSSFSSMNPQHDHDYLCALQEGLGWIGGQTFGQRAFYQRGWGAPCPPPPLMTSWHPNHRLIKLIKIIQKGSPWKRKGKRRTWSQKWMAGFFRKTCCKSQSRTNVDQVQVWSLHWPLAISHWSGAQHRAPGVTCLKHPNWPFELFHWIPFAWSHIICDRYTSDYAHFTGTSFGHFQFLGSAGQNPKLILTLRPMTFLKALEYTIFHI